ncbi:hypothetical protein [Pseudomonas putida]|uniref:Uncharacterized protein n=1 Tax=Pseudomonas putida TaxID=303 RepID=A0A8I1EAW2_PSEPU|nr:hypothetical protein [Pseudomonas putida]MBI6882597.1 hypothetical protein [Pseudomonas putida]
MSFDKFLTAASIHGDAASLANRINSASDEEISGLKKEIASLSEAGISAFSEKVLGSCGSQRALMLAVESLEETGSISVSSFSSLMSATFHSFSQGVISEDDFELAIGRLIKSSEISLSAHDISVTYYLVSGINYYSRENYKFGGLKHLDMTLSAHILKQTRQDYFSQLFRHMSYLVHYMHLPASIGAAIEYGERSGFSEARFILLSGVVEAGMIKPEVLRTFSIGVSDDDFDQMFARSFSEKPNLHNLATFSELYGENRLFNAPAIKNLESIRDVNRIRHIASVLSSKGFSFEKYTGVTSFVARHAKSLYENLGFSDENKKLSILRAVIETNGCMAALFLEIKKWNKDLGLVEPVSGSEAIAKLREQSPSNYKMAIRSLKFIGLHNVCEGLPSLSRVIIKDYIDDGLMDRAAQKNIMITYPHAKHLFIENDLGV